VIDRTVMGASSASTTVASGAVDVAAGDVAALIIGAVAMRNGTTITAGASTTKANGRQMGSSDHGANVALMYRIESGAGGYVLNATCTTTPDSRCFVAGGFEQGACRPSPPQP
jgi:hypothetical protein